MRSQSPTSGSPDRRHPTIGFDGKWLRAGNRSDDRSRHAGGPRPVIALATMRSRELVLARDPSALARSGEKLGAGRA